MLLAELAIQNSEVSVHQVAGCWQPTPCSNMSLSCSYGMAHVLHRLPAAAKIALPALAQAPDPEVHVAPSAEAHACTTGMSQAPPLTVQVATTCMVRMELWVHYSCREGQEHQD